MSKIKQPTALSSTFETSIAVLSLLGISGYLLLRYAVDIGQEAYGLGISFSLSSTIAQIYLRQFHLSIMPVDLPLFAVLLFGGIPSIIQIFAKLFQGNFGADLLAGIAIVTAVCLNEYLAGSLVVLMISGGGVRKAMQFGKPLRF